MDVKILGKTKEQVDRPDYSLEDLVILRLNEAIERSRRIKMVLFIFLALLSIATIYPAISMLTSEVSESGFWEYLKLLASEPTNIVHIWSQLGMALVESFPVMPFALLVAVAILFAYSLKILSSGVSLRKIETKNYFLNI